MNDTIRQPKPVDALAVAFGDISNLPPMDEIPAEFRDYHRNKWCDLAGEWFFNGLGDVTLIAKEGVDRSAALAAVQACLMSFEPSHGHKIAGCGYLLSLWFEFPERESPTPQ